MKRLALLLFLAAGFAQFAYAAAPGDIYRQALDAGNRGEYEQAALLYQQLVDEYPTDKLAPHALFQIGEINERKLSRFETAEEAFRRVLKDFPNKSVARRARRRLQRLETSRATGDEPLRMFNHILRDYRQDDSTAARDQMVNLAQRFPRFGKRDKVLFWIAEDYRRRDQFAEAIVFSRQLIDDYPQSTWAFHAAQNIGYCYIESRDFDEAREAFARLAAFEDRQRGAAAASKHLVTLAEHFKLLVQLRWLSVVIVVIGLIFWLVVIRWRDVKLGLLKTLPIDLTIMIPPLAVGWYYVRNEAVMFPRSFLALGLTVAGAVTLNHLFLATRSPQGQARVAYLFWFLLLVVAITYFVFYQMDLINILFDSIQYEIEYGEPGR
jgi:TolA-binding protein